MINVAKNNIAEAPTIVGYEKGREIPVSDENRPREEAIIASQNEIKGYLQNISNIYGLDYQEIEKVIQCESSFNPNADNGVSLGLCQFIQSTWNANCDITKQRTDWKASIDCMAKMWNKGQQHQWDCWCMLFGKNNNNCKKRGL